MTGRHEAPGQPATTLGVDGIPDDWYWTVACLLAQREGETRTAAEIAADPAFRLSGLAFANLGRRMTRDEINEAVAWRGVNAGHWEAGR